MKHVFIVNPTSGKGDYRRVEEWVNNFFKNRDEEYEIIRTDYPGHATEIAGQYGVDTILYSVGGDGTAHEVLNGMNLEDTVLAIVPVGTGNDFWRMYHIKEPLETILERTMNGTEKQIDIGYSAGRYFLNCLNVGVDAEVNRRVNSSRSKLIPRTFIYMIYAVIELIRKKTFVLEYSFNGEVHSYKTLLASFMNGKWYGGGFKSAPNASFDDGLLDITIVEDVPLRRIPKLLPKYYKGTHLDEDVVNLYRTDKITVKAPRKVAVGLDGEVLELDTFTVEVLKGKLRIMAL